MATLEQLQTRIAKLQNQAEELKRKQSASVIKSIKSTMEKHGLTLEDLAGELSALVEKRRGRPVGSKNAKDAVKSSGSAVRGTLPPKYRNPETGETWSGHARPPIWIKDVADRDVYLIARAGKKKATSTKAPAKKAPTKKVPAKKASRKNGAKSASVAVKASRGRPKGSAGNTAKRAVRGGKVADAGSTSDTNAVA
jgi:DNA-binding protein H-NS